MIKIEITGVNEIIKNINKLVPQATAGALIGVRNSINELKRQAISNLEMLDANTNPRGHGWMVGQYIHYNINKSWEYTEPIVKGDEITMSLYNYSDHAQAVEFGTGQYGERGGEPIVPKTHDYLRFKYNGHWVTRALPQPQVSGQPPKAYLRNAIEINKVYIPILIGNSIMSHIHV